MDMNNRKERRIVSWSQEEDNVLRQLIHKHGTDNWSIIASKFNNKTPRQCRRRWYTYLNSDYKKGGWSQEEDMLLCEAQRIFGNRWTEIAKVVSGRTDNAVKNRFSKLCKKKEKHSTSMKENNAACYPNPSNKRVIPESTSCIKKMRATPKKQLRTPFTVLSQSFINSACHVGGDDGGNNQFGGTFLKKDDPKITALLQQAELLSSLAVKVNADHTIQSLENAWKVIQESMNGGKKGEDENEDKPGFFRRPDLQDSSGSAAGDNAAFSSTDFSSPLQVTKVFGSTPKFSESERKFLLKTLGVESSSSSSSPMKSPSNCRRALINSL